MMEALIEFLDSIHPLSDGLKQHLRVVLKTRTLKKKELLLKGGRVCTTIHFIGKGLLRCYYVLEDGTEITSWFMKEGDVIAAVLSFFRQTPSFEWIQALEDCELTYVTYEELQYIYTHFMEFNYIGRTLVEKYYVMDTVYRYYTRSRKAIERYKYFIDQFPDIVQRVPAKYIASFLGLSEAHYSVAKSAAFS